MSVFVDDVRHRFGRMIMCHMWADSQDELLLAAARIGINRRWLQMPPKSSWVHFDISLSKKELAVRNGAILTDKYGPVEFLTKQRIAILEHSELSQTGNIKHRIKKLYEKLRQIELIRAHSKSTAKENEDLHMPAQRSFL